MRTSAETYNSAPYDLLVPKLPQRVHGHPNGIVMMVFTRAVALLCLAITTYAQLPAEVTDLTTITGVNGTSVRYKTNELCETTPGVKSYSGYVDIADDKHLFFWFLESRNQPSSDPITLWLNGGPGADSLGGLLDELGPCRVNEGLSLDANPYSWNEVSNMLFLSQPVGVGFSYGSKVEIDVDLPPAANDTEPQSRRGRYPNADYPAINSTVAAAEDAWKAVQTFYRSLPELNDNIKSKTFNLATQSYGGHWGPVFFNYIRKQNDAETDNVTLDIGALLVIQGLIDYKTQAPSYPRFARNNTHGVELNDTFASYMETALHMPSLGCLDLLDVCKSSEEQYGEFSLLAAIQCNTAVSLCRNAVELIYSLNTPEQDVYDIRNHSLHPQPVGAWPAWLNTGEVQQALGVDFNYSGSNSVDVYGQFHITGDWVRSRPLTDLSELLESGTRVALLFGDADYILNWLGGQDLSLAVNFTGSESFRNSGYVPLVADGKRYGDTRETDIFSFTRLFDAGHDAPFYQPKAGLEIFNRTIHGWDIATGAQVVGPGFATVGDKESTYSQKEGDSVE